MSAPTPAAALAAGMAIVSAVAQGDRAAAVDVLNGMSPAELAGVAYSLAGVVTELAGRLPGGVALVLDVAARLDLDTPPAGHG